MDNLSQVINIISISLVPILLGMVCHEVAHGWMAMKMGDPTAKKLGRLTLNPLVHLDPLGTLVFVVTAVSSGMTGQTFIFGWAKPVPINPGLFRKFRKGLFLVSIAGAGANVLLAAAFAVLLRLLVFLSSQNLAPLVFMGNSFLVNMCVVGIFINLTLAFFNLLPVPPLDGSKVLASFLPPQAARSYFRLERFGLLIVLVLLMTGLLGRVLGPLVFNSAFYLLKLVGLSL